MRCTLRGVLLILLQIQNMSMQKKCKQSWNSKSQRRREKIQTWPSKLRSHFVLNRCTYNDAAINGAKMLDRFCLFIRSLSFLKRHDFHSIVEIFALHLWKRNMLGSQEYKIQILLKLSQWTVCIFKIWVIFISVRKFKLSLAYILFCVRPRLVKWSREERCPIHVARCTTWCLPTCPILFDVIR